MRVCSWDVNTNQSQDSGERGWSVFIRIDKLGRVWNFTQWINVVDQNIILRISDAWRKSAWGLSTTETCALNSST